MSVVVVLRIDLFLLVSCWRTKVTTVVADAVVALVAIKHHSFATEPIVHVLVEAPKLGRTVYILQIVLTWRLLLTVCHRVVVVQGRQRTIDVFTVLQVLLVRLTVVMQLWKFHLVSGVLVFAFVQVVLVLTDHMHVVVAADAHILVLTGKTYEIRGGATVVVAMVVDRTPGVVDTASLCRTIINVSFVLVARVGVLAVDDGHPCHLLLGHLVVVFIPPHDEVFFSFLEANRSYWFGSIC